METQQAASSPSTESSAPMSLTEAFSTDASTGSSAEVDVFGEREQVEQTPADAASTTGDAPAGEATATDATQSAATDETGDEIPAELAAEYSLDPKNPAHRKALQALAKIAAAQPSTAATDNVAEELTEFERQHLTPEKPAAEATATSAETAAAAETKPLEPGKFGDLGDAWNSPVDAYKAIGEEYARDEPDLMKIHQLESAMFVRRMTAIGTPFVQKLIADALKSSLGDLPEQMKASQAKARSDSNYNFAVSELSKSKGFEGLGKLFEPQSDAKVKFEGRDYPDTPANRILAEHPEVLDIRVNHADPDTAERLTEMKRLRHMHKLWAMKQTAKKALPAGQAAKIFDAGAESAAKNPADRTRQSLNSGRSASGNGDTPNPDSWFKSGAHPDAVSISDLLGK